MNKCKNCTKEFNEVNPKIGKHFCNYSCYIEYQSNHTSPNTKCTICDKEFYLKPFRLKRVKHGVTCSKKCKTILQSNYMKGKGNHQYGITGPENSSFVGAKRLNQYGYVMLYLPDHPLADSDGRYREHRYIVEQSIDFDDSFFNIISGIRVLKPEYDVHHMNEKRDDNRVENLLILTRGEHVALHNNTKVLLRNGKGQIIGVIKSRELLENPGEDNQQPSLDGDILEGSTTSSESQVDNNSTTSAGQVSKSFKVIFNQKYYRPDDIV